MAKRKPQAHRSKRRARRRMHPLAKAMTRGRRKGIWRKGFKRGICGYRNHTRNTQCILKEWHMGKHYDGVRRWGKPLRIVRGGRYLYLQGNGKYRAPWPGERHARRPPRRASRRRGHRVGRRGEQTLRDVVNADLKAFGLKPLPKKTKWAR